MGVRLIKLRGFHADVLKMIQDGGFRFSDPDLRDYKLVVDRNLFASDMPDPADIAVTASSEDNGFPFDPLKEPAIAIYRQPGSGVTPSMSSFSGLAFNLLVVLRVPKTLEDALGMLDELVSWLENNAVGYVGEDFIIRHYQTLGLPIPYQRLADDKSAASATLRFLAVARP